MRDYFTLSVASLACITGPLFAADTTTATGTAENNLWTLIAAAVAGAVLQFVSRQVATDKNKKPTKKRIPSPADHPLLDATMALLRDKVDEKLKAGTPPADLIR